MTLGRRDFLRLGAAGLSGLALRDSFAQDA